MKSNTSTTSLSIPSTLHFPKEKWRRIRDAAVADGISYNGLLVNAVQMYRHRLEHGDSSPVTSLDAVKIRRAARDAAEAVIVGRKGRVALHESSKNEERRPGMAGILMAPLKLPKDLHAWLRQLRKDLRDENREQNGPVLGGRGKTGRQALTMGVLTESAITEHIATRVVPERKLSLEEGTLMRKIANLARQRRFEDLAKEKGLDPAVFLLKDEAPISLDEENQLLAPAKNKALYQIALAEVTKNTDKLSLSNDGSPAKPGALSAWTSLHFTEKTWEDLRNAAVAEGVAYNGMVVDALQRYRYQLATGTNGPVTGLEAVRMQRAARDAAEAVIVGRKGRLGLLGSATPAKPRNLPDEVVIGAIKLPRDLHAWVKANQKKAGVERSEKPVASPKRGKPGQRDFTMGRLVERAADEYIDRRLAAAEPFSLEDGETMRRIATLARQRHFQDIAEKKGLAPSVFLLKGEEPISDAEKDRLLASDRNAALYNLAADEISGVKVRKSILNNEQNKAPSISEPAGLSVSLPADPHSFGSGQGSSFPAEPAFSH